MSKVFGGPRPALNTSWGAQPPGSGTAGNVALAAPAAAAPGGPAGTTALSWVGPASLTWARSGPKKTLFAAAAFAKCRPVRVTASPTPTVVGVTPVSSGGVL